MVYAENNCLIILLFLHETNRNYAKIPEILNISLLNDLFRIWFLINQRCFAVMCDIISVMRKYKNSAYLQTTTDNIHNPVKFERKSLIPLYPHTIFMIQPELQCTNTADLALLFSVSILFCLFDLGHVASQHDTTSYHISDSKLDRKWKT